MEAITLKYLLLFMALSFTKSFATNRNEIKFGAFFEQNDPEVMFIYKTFLELATQAWSKKNYAIKTVQRTVTCNDIEISEETSKLIHIDDVDIFFGPPCTQSACERALESAEYNKKPIITYRCNDANFKDITHFLKIQPTVKQKPEKLAKLFAGIAEPFQWKHIGLIYSENNGWPILQNKTAFILQELGFYTTSFSIQKNGSPKFLMRRVKERARENIINILREFSTTIENKEQKASDDTNKADWAIFMVEYDSSIGKHLGYDLTNALRGVFNIRASTSRDLATDEYKKMKGTIEKMYTSKTKKQLKKKPDAFEDFFSEASYLYDGLSIYTKTIDWLIEEEEKRVVQDYLKENMIHDFLMVNNLTLNEYTNSSTNRTWHYPKHWKYFNETQQDRNDSLGPKWYRNNASLPVVDIEGVKLNISHVEIIKNSTRILLNAKEYNFTGLSGQIFFSATGFREPNLLIENINGNITKKNTDYKKLFKEKIVWYGGFIEAPEDIPECGFNEECEGRDWRVTIVMSAMAISLFICIIAFRAYKMRKYENDINSKDSILSFKDLTTDILPSHVPLEDKILKQGEHNKITGIRKLIVIHNGNRLMLKKLPKKSVFIGRKILMEWKHLRDLNQSNINKFRGVTTVPPNICILQDYCAKGSLYDILNKEDVHLDWDFKHTFINDIATAMLAIHDSPIKVHGHLTSKNCLINHRWVIEVADFGLTELRKEEGSVSQEAMQQNIERARCKELLWTAPEHLVYPITSSKQGDVYSFGIIVSEIINQRPPYTERDEMRPHEIIHFVRKRCIPPFRPHVTLKIGLDNKLDALMKSCWSEEPNERPTFRQIKPIVKQIRGTKVEIIDNMISMMEKYSGELEKSVKEGNDVLLKERAKNNEFLYKSLPRPIGDIIISGGTFIQPHYAPLQGLLMVTIHDLTSYEYTPFQFIDILNDYQKLVDKILIQHKNVYRLYSFREEIMLCSNINGFKPESEAQDLLSIAIKIVHGRDLFPWRHIRNRKLQLRVTLHCGPGTGIVVGNKVPTYCCLGNHYELIKVLNLNSPEEKIIMTKEFRKVVNLRRDEVIKLGHELLVCTYIGKVEPIVVKEAPKGEDEKNLSIIKPYIIPGPSMFPPKEKVKDTIKYMDVGSNIDTMFDKWYKVDAMDKKTNAIKKSKRIIKMLGNITAKTNADTGKTADTEKINESEKTTVTSMKETDKVNEFQKQI